MTEPILETDRLILRLPRESDFPTYEAYYADPIASAFSDGPLRPDQAWRKLATDIGHWRLRGYWVWAVVRKLDGEMIGRCGFYWPSGWPRRELTWWLTTNARRQGFAAEASRAVVKFAYGELGWELVETHMLDSNEAARGLVESLGGKVIAREEFPDGQLRNVYAVPNSSSEAT